MSCDLSLDVDLEKHYKRHFGDGNLIIDWVLADVREFSLILTNCVWCDDEFFGYVENYFYFSECPCWRIQRELPQCL